MRIVNLLRRVFFTLLLFLPFRTVAANSLPKFNMTPGVTPISRDIYLLHMTIFWICVAIGVVVFSVLIYSIVKHRKSKAHKPADFHSSLKIEILWAVVPFLILVAMAIPATMVIARMDDSAKADLNIKIVGYQWKWEYDYLDQGIRFFSTLSTPRAQLDNKAKKGKWYLLEVDKPLVVPIHKKIRFLVTSNDVIHSWWVPALGVKRDAIPGFIHEAWARIDKPGTYRGQCAELCGINHAYMPIVVVAKTQEDFDKWVALQQGKVEEVTTDKTKTKPEQKAEPKPKPQPPTKMTKEALMQEGEKVYLSHCSVCHKPNGLGMPPAFPALKGGKITTGPVVAHIDIVLNGKTGTAMQAFKEQLNDTQLAAVITYERNSWGNTGGIVQPEDIQKARK